MRKKYGLHYYQNKDRYYYSIDIVNAISASNFSFDDTGEEYKARIVLQVRIKPGVYKIGPSTVANHSIDPDFKDSELEWMTDRECVHYISGVLVKLEMLKPYTMSYESQQDLSQV